MAETENLDDEFFADLYADDEPAAAPSKTVAPERTSKEASTQDAMVDDTPSNNQATNGDGHAMNEDSEEEEDDDDIDFNLGDSSTNIPSASGSRPVDTPTHTPTPTPVLPHSKGPSAKEDGKMFIGGLNWETTDQSLRDYFSQFGEVVECTVMRDGATGRSRGFGFLTFKDPKTVNIVMVKEHHLDGKIIDPKRAIPRDEQEKTSKIFVGGVSQECTDQEFKEYFAQFGRVVDATLMMDKDTGRPRGFGFVTFESEAGVEACLSTHLEIHGKAIEVKKAQPRGNMREEEEAARRGAKFGKGKFAGGTASEDGALQATGGQNTGQGANNMGMSPQVMAQAFQRMQAWMSMVQQQQMMMGGGRGMASMNPAMMQQMMMQQQQQMQMMGGGGGRGQGNAGGGPGGMMGGMNPAMMQQMLQAQQGGGPNGPNGGRPAYNAYEQQMYEQQKYEQQQNRRALHGGGGSGFQGGGGGYGGGGNQNNWEGMYDDPQPAMMGGSGRGGFHRGSPRQQGPGDGPPANAPTGPKNAGKPGANLYRGGGRGGSRGFHPYSRP